jgi:hypothetical protein
MTKDITLAMLSWRQPRTLRNSLESYARNGLLNLAKEKIIYFNECTLEDKQIAKNYGFSVLESKRNKGIALPFQDLVKAATCENFLFLENDFMLIEDTETTIDEINAAIELLSKGIECVRLRHRHHYGDPNYWLQRIWLGKADLNSANLNSVYCLESPDKVYSEITKRSTDGREFFISSSQFANFTNNPCIYKTEFLKKNFLNISFSEFDNLEKKIEEWWCTAGIKIAQGNGLFKHHPLEVSGSGFIQHKRIKHPIKHWSHYVLRLGYKRGVFNIFLLQFLPMLIKANINFNNRIMFNLSVGRYESE